MKKHLSFLFVLCFLGACQPPSNEFVPAPTPIVKDTDYCEAAGKRLEELKCKESVPTKTGKTFAEFCRETQNAGIYLNPVCLSKITNCNQVNCCTNTESCPVPQ